MTGVAIGMDFGFPEKPLRMVHPLTGEVIMANTVLCICIDTTDQVIQELPFAEHLPQSECQRIVEWFAKQVNGESITGPNSRYIPPIPTN